jgi:pyruvate,water dikinase
MFTVNDIELEQGARSAKNIKTELPMNLCVLDLGGGLALEDSEAKDVLPSQIVSKPFQSLWKGISHPEVSWKREMPASLSDFATVMANSFTPQNNTMRTLGQKSYLLVADDYVNLNSRLAYHFSLVDACLSDIPSQNYISFRFAGGGATRYRRNLRACFVEACLTHYGYTVDRRGDLVNAWLKKALPAEMDEKLDILGRLLACTSQLDMYMTNRNVMTWYVEQFLSGNYSFTDPEEKADKAPSVPVP